MGYNNTFDPQRISTRLLRNVTKALRIEWILWQYPSNEKVHENTSMEKTTWERRIILN
jgi:hypothetical protein